MTGIIKIDDTALNLLPTNSAREYVKDKFTGRVIRTLPYDQTIDLVCDIVHKGMKNLGHWEVARDSGNIMHTAEQVISAIINAKEFKKGRTTYDLRNLTIEELDRAITEGTSGSYKKKPDEVLVVSASSIIGWAESYITEDSRQAAIKYYGLLLNGNTAKKEPTPEEVEKMLKNACNRAYEDFKTDGTLPYACGVIYDYFKKHKGIVWTKEQREQIEKEADLAYKQKLKGTRDEPTKDGLKAEKKRVALKHYFNSLIKK